MARSLRLLPLHSADGPSNMAADEVLLESAASDGTASLRFYTWTEPTLSLGYFQPSEAGRTLGAAIPSVRRSTGGAAIVHHHELTYAIALPAARQWHSDESWICRFHRLLQSVLAAGGIRSHLVACGEEKKLGEVLCFLHQTPGDLVIGGSKVAGSAQRRRWGTLLQHGSLLLRRSEHAPILPGIHDAAGHELFPPPLLAERLQERLAADTGCRMVRGDWSDEEIERRAAIREEKYANAEWNGRR